MAKFNHSMTELCAALDAKIEALERVRETVKENLKNNIGVSVNADALSQIQESLSHTRDARAAAEMSCCSFSCDIEYE